MRRTFALGLCPDIRDEIAALQSGNTKVVLENAKLLDEIEHLKKQAWKYLQEAGKQARARS